MKKYVSVVCGVALVSGMFGCSSLKNKLGSDESSNLSSICGQVEEKTKEGKIVSATEKEAKTLTDDPTEPSIIVPTEASNEIVAPTAETSSPLSLENYYIGDRNNVCIGIVTTMETTLNFRTLPGFASEVVGNIPKGAEVLILEQPLIYSDDVWAIDSSMWYLIEWDGKIGYACVDYITPTDRKQPITDKELIAIAQMRFSEAFSVIQWSYAQCFTVHESSYLNKSNQIEVETDYGVQSYFELPDFHSKNDMLDKIHELFSSKYDSNKGNRSVSSAFDYSYLCIDDKCYANSSIFNKGDLFGSYIYKARYNITMNLKANDGDEVFFSGYLDLTDWENTTEVIDEFSIVFENGRWKIGIVQSTNCDNGHID